MGAKQTRLPGGKQERGKVWFSSAELVMEETPKLGKRQETIKVIACFFSLVRAPYQGRSEGGEKKGHKIWGRG